MYGPIDSRAHGMSPAFTLASLLSISPLWWMLIPLPHLFSLFSTDSLPLCSPERCLQAARPQGPSESAVADEGLENPSPPAVAAKYQQQRTRIVLLFMFTQASIQHCSHTGTETGQTWVMCPSQQRGPWWPLGDPQSHLHQQEWDRWFPRKDRALEAVQVCWEKMLGRHHLSYNDKNSG